MTNVDRLLWFSPRVLMASGYAFAVWWLAALAVTWLFPSLDTALPISPIWAANALAYGAVLVSGLRLVPAFALAALTWNLLRGDSLSAIVMGTGAFTLMLLGVAVLAYELTEHVKHDRARRLLGVPLVALTSASVFALLGAWQFSEGRPSQALWMGLWLSETISVLLFAPLAQQVSRYGLKASLPTTGLTLGSLWLWLAVAGTVLAVLWQLGEGATLWHRGAPYLAVMVPILAIYWLPSTLARGLMALFIVAWVLVNVSITVQPSEAFNVLEWLSRQWVIFIASLVGFLSIEAVRGAEAASRRLAQSRLEDGVTGLTNELGIHELASRLSAEEVSVIGVQVPNADQLAALVGEATVHEIEQQIAQQLHVQCGPDSLGIARLRPGLFALVLDRNSIKQRYLLAEQLTQLLCSDESNLALPSTHLGVKVVILPSVLATELGSVAALLLTACRQANWLPYGNLYRYPGTASELIGQQSEEAAWVQRLRAALSGDTRQGELKLYAQPIVSLENVDQPRCEILLRWYTPGGRLLAPHSFLHIAETFGLMPQIDRWVVEHALAMLTQHPNGRRLACVSVNLSGDSLACGWLVGTIDTLIRRYAWPAKKLCLELTESALIHDAYTAELNMQGLHRLGVRLAIDDFGTGRATFAYLKQYPAEELKIDGSFIRQLESSAFDQEVVRTTCALAQQLNARVVAEFVENDTQIKLLDELGVHFLQGYGLAQPLPLNDYLATLDTLSAAWHTRFVKP